MRFRTVASAVLVAAGAVVPCMAVGQAQAQEPWCGASWLGLTVEPVGQSSGSQRTASIVLTNLSRESCVLQGFPGVDLAAVGDNGRAALPRTNEQGQPVLLPPGGQAKSTLTYATGTDTPTEIIVTPPDSTTQLHAVWPTALGSIMVWPEGATHPGTYIGPLRG
ncbi:DUF4232 domain-containing protein [Nocardia sp. NBC_01503]|uniref:DUF4232 domain-containing protein n=1 Tax=Nocardia sp. NBC_01503 TaxID=2975997 RepID=UPI002E7B823C|nr:DUF4232 domain-containing protein [Nocardia sp. NBC_01503]WTL35523.1 DUF4232 domain-containing protein [Nocardia sp. NBC_01503]